MVISKENQHRQVLRLSEIENSPSPVFEGKPYKSSEVNRLVHLWWFIGYIISGGNIFRLEEIGYTTLRPFPGIYYLNIFRLEEIGYTTLRLFPGIYYLNIFRLEEIGYTTLRPFPGIYYFWRINIFIGTPWKFHLARILFSRKRL